MVQQVSVFLENSKGRLALLARALGDSGINMRALMVADTEDFGVVRVICDRPASAKAALEELGFGAALTPVVAVEIPDRPGGLADVLETLDAAGLNVEYAYCFVEPSGDAAVDIFKVDAAGAGDVLRSAGFTVLSASELYEPDPS